MLEGHEAKVRALCSLGGLLASGSEDNTVRIWSAEDGSERHVLRSHEGWVKALCSLGGVLLASASDDNTVRIWSAEDGSERHVLRGQGIMTKKTPSFLSGSHMQNHALLRSVCSDRHDNWWGLTG